MSTYQLHTLGETMTNTQEVEVRPHTQVSTPQLVEWAQELHMILGVAKRAWVSTRCTSFPRRGQAQMAGIEQRQRWHRRGPRQFVFPARRSCAHLVLAAKVAQAWDEVSPTPHLPHCPRRVHG